MKTELKNPNSSGSSQFPDQPNFFVPLGKHKKRKRDKIYYSMAILFTLTLVVILGIVFSRGWFIYD